MLIDSPIALRSNFARKGIAQIYQAKRILARLGISSEVYRSYPSVVANSIPKSGTHLLLQLTRSLPRVRYYGTFIASTPSLSLVPLTQARTSRMIGRIAPAETLGAHLYHTDETASALREMSAVHFFIIRDPRDIVVSEAHYLGYMNRFHRISGEFARAADDQARIRLSICGSQERPDIFPDFEQRNRPYVPWLMQPDTVTLRYEGLATGSRDEYRKIARAYAAATGAPETAIEPMTETLIGAVDPAKSHTHRVGNVGEWRTAFGRENEALFEQICGPICRDLGYR